MPALAVCFAFSTKNQYPHLFNGLCIKEQDRRKERKKEGSKVLFRINFYVRQGLGRLEITVLSYLVTYY